MKTSLIITTYNWVAALELSIKSALNQNVLPDEIIIADDGSTVETKNLVDKFTINSSVKIIHSWQEDKGFRLARSRNIAIARSLFEYVIIVDGDMILDKNFIKDHIKNAQQECFIQATRVSILEEKSKKMLASNKLKLGLFTKGIINRRHAINNKILSIIFSQKNINPADIKGCNMSFFKKDIIKVNGYNEDFKGWGAEDNEFSIRLFNNNIVKKKIRFNCNAYHIYHQENSQNRLTINGKILNRTKENKLTWCENGINQHL